MGVKLLNAIPCQKIIVDSQTGLVSIHEILENISFVLTEEKPQEKDSPYLMQINFQLLTYWYSSKAYKRVKRISFKVDIIDPREKVISSNSMSFELKAGNTRFKHILRYNGIKFNNSGEHYFRIIQKEKVLTEIPFNITHEI